MARCFASWDLPRPIYLRLEIFRFTVGKMNNAAERAGQSGR
jgi:hypothetical protein